MESLEKETELCFPHLNSSCKKPNSHSQKEAVLIYTLLYITALLTTVLNLLVIIAISHFRHCDTLICNLDTGLQLHSSTNFILLSLAVSDFFVGFVVIPVESLMSRTCWVLGDIMCVVYYAVPITLVSASVGNMVLISVDRYVAICNPMHYQTRMTLKVIGVCIFVCWIGSLIYTFLLMYENIAQPGRYTSCYGECVINVSGEADLVIVFIIPVTIIVVLYLRVFVVAASQARAMRSHVANHQSSLISAIAKKSEIKAARNLGVVIVVFLVCYSPYYCVSLISGNLLIGSPTEMFMSFWMYFNSTLNPIIYALFYPWFRKAIKLIVTLQILQPGSCDARIL